MKRKAAEVTRLGSFLGLADARDLSSHVLASSQSPGLP